jgi:4-aminobutyrate aminotransferase
MAELSPQLKPATPVVVDRGEGVYLFDEDDRCYLDFTAGIGVTSTGHCNPAVVAAAQEQVARLIHEAAHDHAEQAPHPANGRGPAWSP